MKLFTEVKIPDYPFVVDHHKGILMMGSCFTENIGRLLDRYLFPVCINPFGVIYNPFSVRKGIDALVHKESYAKDDLEEYNGLWFSFDHYSGFSSPEQEVALNHINLEFQQAKKSLQEAEFLFLTWGSAWIYTYRKSGEVVCNCHKIPAGEFSRSRLSVEEIVDAYSGLLQDLFKINPALKVILTVSPVRHWKDGAHGNQLSKATLLLAGEQLVQKFSDRVFYFPAYEILMDELRDYRFYADDLLHPSEKATAIIWEKLLRSMVSESSAAIINDLEPWLRMREHRPQIKEGNSYSNMMMKLSQLQEDLQQKYPFLNLNPGKE